MVTISLKSEQFLIPSPHYNFPIVQWIQWIIQSQPWSATFDLKTIQLVGVNYIFLTRTNWLSDYEFNESSNLFMPTLRLSILSTLLSGFRTDPLHSLGVEYCLIIKTNMLSWNPEDEFNEPSNPFMRCTLRQHICLIVSKQLCKVVFKQGHCTCCKCLFLECFGIDILTSYVNQVAFRKFLPSTIQSPYKLHPSAHIVSLDNSTKWLSNWFIPLSGDWVSVLRLSSLGMFWIQFGKRLKR